MKKTVLLDGATGTRLWELAAAAGYDRVPTWRYNLEHPELVEQVAKEYIAAGSDMICTNSFAVNRVELSHSKDAPGVEAVTAAAVRIAKAATAGTQVKVALDIGPLPMLMEPFGDLTEEAAEEYYAEILRGGMAEQPDVIFFETFTSLDMLCAAVTAEKAYDIPVLCSMSFERHGKTLMGDSPEEIAKRVEELGAAAVGLNCSFGPVAALPVIRVYAAHTKLPLILKPNLETDCGPAQFAEEISPALELVAYAGACCGSNPECIRSLKALLCK